MSHQDLKTPFVFVKVCDYHGNDERGLSLVLCFQLSLDSMLFLVVHKLH